MNGKKRKNVANNSIKDVANNTKIQILIRSSFFLS